MVFVYKYSAKAYLHLVISEMYFQARTDPESFQREGGVGGDSIQKKEGGWGIDSKFDEKFNVRVI